MMMMMMMTMMKIKISAPLECVLTT